MGALIDQRNLILPRELPDGSVQWEERTDLARKVREGDPTLGWSGDPTLSIVFVTDLDGKGPAWQLWQRLENREATVLATRLGERIPGDDFIRQLVAHDTRHVDVRAMVDAENVRAKAAREQAFSEHNREKADRLAHSLVKDLDIPAPDGKFFPLR